MRNKRLIRLGTNSKRIIKQKLLKTKFAQKTAEVAFSAIGLLSQLFFQTVGFFHVKVSVLPVIVNGIYKHIFLAKFRILKFWREKQLNF